MTKKSKTSKDTTVKGYKIFAVRSDNPLQRMRKYALPREPVWWRKYFSAVQTPRDRSGSSSQLGERVSRSSQRVFPRNTALQAKSLV